MRCSKCLANSLTKFIISSSSSTSTSLFVGRYKYSNENDLDYCLFPISDDFLTVSVHIQTVVVHVSRGDSTRDATRFKPQQTTAQVLHLRAFFVPHVPRLLGQFEDLCNELASRPPHFAATTSELNSIFVCQIQLSSLPIILTLNHPLARTRGIHLCLLADHYVA